MFKTKPVLSADAPGRSKAGGPFLNPDPSEILADLGSTHRLLLNKFSLYRPMLIAATRDYQLQTDNLNAQDFEAVWAVLKAFKMPLIMFYNCGVNAGSSQGHKHMQLFPRAPSQSLWPDAVVPEDGELAIKSSQWQLKSRRHS